MARIKFLDLMSMERLLLRVDSLLKDHTLRMAPHRGRSIYIFHPALGYYCRQFGLRQESVEKDGKEPTPAHLAELQESMKRDGARAILVQREFDRSHAEVLSRSLGIEIISIDPLQYDWFRMMDELATAIEQALNGNRAKN